MIAPGQVATLILPSDTSWNDGGVVAEALPRLPPPSSSPNQIEAAAEALRRGGADVVLLLGGVALSRKDWRWHIVFRPPRDAASSLRVQMRAWRVDRGVSRWSVCPMSSMLP